MGALSGIEEASVKLNDTIAVECARFGDLNTLRNPYKDFEKYFLPLAVALASWVVSIFVHWTCDLPVCTSIKTALGRIYMSIFCILLVVFWRQIQGAFANVQLLLGEISKGAVKAKAE